MGSRARRLVSPARFEHILFFVSRVVVCCFVKRLTVIEVCLCCELTGIEVCLCSKLTVIEMCLWYKSTVFELRPSC